MYFDIVLIYCHQKQKQKTPPTNRKQKHNRGDGGEGPVMVRQASHGSPMLAPLPFFLKKTNKPIEMVAWAIVRVLPVVGLPR